MKKIILLLTTFFCVSAMAFSTNKPVECFGTPDVTKLLKEEIQEEPVFNGVNVLTGKSVVTLFVNYKTGTWTLVEYDQDYACVLAAGKNSST
jgi:hypothetical protein